MIKIKNVIIDQWNRLTGFEKILTVIGFPVLLAFGLLWLSLCIVGWPIFFFIRIVNAMEDDRG